jgi:hypothetical protein
MQNMNDACTRKPEGGKLTATHEGKIKEFLKNVLQRIFELKRIYNGYFGFLVFLAHFDPEFKGVIENL